MNKFSVIIPAAGIGKRFAQDLSRAGFNLPSLVEGGRDARPTGFSNLTKIEIDLAGKPVFLWSVEKFARREDVEQVILAVNPDTKDEFIQRWGRRLACYAKEGGRDARPTGTLSKIEVVAGGKKERWQTVQKAIEHVNKTSTHIAVHDAARPLVSDELIESIFKAAGEKGALLPGVPIADTLKRANENSKRIEETISRKNLYSIQTPQVFKANLLRKAYKNLAENPDLATTITDDAGLVEALGEDVYITESQSTNFKITTPADYKLAQILINAGA